MMYYRVTRTVVVCADDLHDEQDRWTDYLEADHVFTCVDPNPVQGVVTPATTMDIFSYQAEHGVLDHATLEDGEDEAFEDAWNADDDILLDIPLEGWCDCSDILKPPSLDERIRRIFTDGG